MSTNRFDTDSSPVSFGRYIRAIRIQKGIDLKTVSDALKVTLHKLSLIEAEDHEELPDDIYVKGILRAYADYIGLDADDLIDRYEINRSAYINRSESPSRGMRRREKMLPRMLLSLLLLACIGGASVALFYQSDAIKPDTIKPDAGQTRTVKPRGETGAAGSAEPSGRAAAVQRQAPSPAEAPAGQPEAALQAGPGDQSATGKLVLTIDAVAKTWVKINIDGEEPLEYLLRPKDHVELEADSHFSMLIGNAAGLRMHLNDRPVQVPGQAGEVVTLELPRPQSDGN